jgi:hypothetical protein
VTALDNPDDIEFVALTLIKRSTSGLTLSGASLEAFVHMLRAVVGALGAERAFASLSWPDAEQVADAITSTLIDNAADAAENLCQRTRDALAGTDGIVWNDREAAARALN